MADCTTTTVGRPFLSVFIFSLTAAAAAAVPYDSGPVFRLLVLHTNDMHSRFQEVDQIGAQCRVPPCYGGFARLKTAADEARDQVRSSNIADGTLFLNAGDTFQGTAFYTYFKWKAVAQMMEPLGIDVMSLGNHEFDDGVEDIRLFIHNITIPVVASNLDLTDEPSLAKEPNLMKSKVLTVNGHKIGIIGYLTPETKVLGDVGNVKILPEIPSITAEVKRLKNEGVNILIALGHSGFEMDKQIAEQVDDIDLVIGGHTNTFLYNGDSPDIIDEPVGPYPLLVKQPRTNREVPVVQASHITKYLGKLWIEFDGAGEVIRSYGNPVLLDYRFGKDPELSNQIRDMEKLLEENTNTVIGSTRVFLQGTDMYCRFGECNFGDLVTDAFVDYNLRTNVKPAAESWTDAPIAMVQGGGLRSNINHKSDKGNITSGDLLLSIPFRNDVGKITIKGSDIWNAFEHSVHRYSKNIPNGEFLQVSGLRVVIDLDQPSGKRVQSVYARCGDCTVPVYQKLDLDANYTIITVPYILKGGDGFTFTNISDYISFGITDEDLVKQYIGLKSPIWPEVGQRIILLHSRKQRESVTSNSNGGQNVLTSSLLSNLLLLFTIIVMVLF